MILIPYTVKLNHIEDKSQRKPKMQYMNTKRSSLSTTQKATSNVRTSNIHTQSANNAQNQQKQMMKRMKSIMGIPEPLKQSLLSFQRSLFLQDQQNRSFPSEMDTPITLSLKFPLSDHLEKLHQDFTLSCSQLQLSKHFSKPLPCSLSKTLETHPPPTACFYLLRFSSASFSPPLQLSHTLSL